MKKNDQTEKSRNEKVSKDFSNLSHSIKKSREKTVSIKEKFVLTNRTNDNENLENKNIVKSYIQTLAKEMAKSLKKNRRDSIEETLDSIFSKLPNQEKRTSILDYETLPHEFTKNYESNTSESSSSEKHQNNQKHLLVNNHKTLMKENFNQRNKIHVAKKLQKIEFLKSKKRIEEEKNLKFKPTINNNTNKIIQQKIFKPIHYRLEEEIEKKRTNLAILKKEYNDCKRLKEDHDFETYQSVKHHFDEDRFEEWRLKQLKWKNDKIVKSLLKNHEKLRLETEEAKTYHNPIIDKNSETISITLNTNKGTSIFDKLYMDKDERHKRQVTKLLESLPSFSPSLNNRRPKFAINNNNGIKFSSDRNIEKKTLTPDNLKRNMPKTYDLNSSLKEKNNKFSSVNYQTIKTMNETFDTKTNLYLSNLLAASEEQEYYSNEEDLISKYRNALDRNDSLKIMKNRKKIEAINIIDGSNLDQVDWKLSATSVSNIEKVAKKGKIINEKLNSFDDNYKINVRNGTACNTNKENVVIYKPKYILKGLN